MTTSVDIDVHMTDTIRLLLSEQHSVPLDWCHVRELLYGDLQFAGAITYHLDQWNPSTKLDTIDTIVENNRTPNPQTAHIERFEEVTNSYTWTAEHAVSVGISISTSFKVPFVGGISTDISTEYSFSKTEATTEARVRSWKFIQDVLVSPHATLTAVLMLEKTTPRVPFDLRGAFTGHIKAIVGIAQPGPVVGYIPFEVRYPITRIFERRPLSQFHFEGNTVYSRTNGVFTASEGITAIIDLTEEPLGQRAQAPKHWIIDVTPEHEILAPDIPPEAKP